ncbi:MAG: hypothetical protein IAE79_06850 [Anaerolinea sp.]|nr:hypothetical protein [Anaerolinea sp.]
MNVTQTTMNPYSVVEIEHLIAEGKLLRLLQPDIKATVEKALQQHDEARAYVVENGNELYLSFLTIQDTQQRERIYQLVQRYQTGEQINLSVLPVYLKQLLQPELTGVGRLLGAVLLGAFAGVAVGILAMAVSTLALNLLGLVMDQVSVEFAGMRITAVIFIIFSALGWTAGAIIAWRRLRSWAQISAQAEIIRGKFWRR